jgi:hypothetical protein
MAHSFGVVEDKLREAEFFLERLRVSSWLSFEARCYFSAFVSAARSVTLALQASLRGVAGFDTWYEEAQRQLKTHPLAPYFVEIRNHVIHTGINPLNQVTLEHLREHLSRQFNQHRRSHVLVLPHAQNDQATVLVDAVQASTLYFISLVGVIFECYRQFKEVVDARWHYTQQNFEAMGKTFEDAISEMGFPPAWAACAPSGTERWRALRLQQPQCQINDLFQKYLGQQIDDPDDFEPRRTEI